MASASPFALEDPSGFCPWIIVVGDSLAIVGSTLTVLYIYRQISIARHFQKEQLKHKSNPNTLEETRVSKTAKRFQPCQILTTNLLILHAALWAIVRSTLHLTFTIKQIRDYDAFVITASNIYQVEWKRSDMKDLWGGTQTFTWGTLLFTAIPTLWMVRQFFPKAFPPRARALSLLWDILLVFGFAILWILSSCPTTASLGVSLVMLASVNLIMASLLSSMLEIQRHATRAKVQGREIKILDNFVKGVLGFLVVSIIFVTAMFVMTLPMLFDVDRNGRELNPSGPGLINSNLTVDMIGFVLEISAVQFFHAWLLVTMKRLETCPIDEWAIGREEVHQDRFGPVRALKMVFRNLWRLLTYQRNAQKKPRTYTPAPPTP